MRFRSVFIACLFTSLLASTNIVFAEDMVYATGRVFAADGRTPLSGATVAVYDDKNRVVDYAKQMSVENIPLPYPAVLST